ncbi:MAG: hypothetical protein E7158_01110 [Firmicutes bacterium]|nr:hypothetical protein [Bacillota bacterium]
MKITLFKLEYLFLLFIIYSFLGWFLEVTCKSIENKRLINRGFLIGPWCPIYGWGCILIIFLLTKFSENFFALFCMSIIICSVLEYFTSYIMEKIFKARWWDYSRWKYNINGRICLETMIPFGILGSLVVYYLHPFILSIINRMSNQTISTLSLILIAFFIMDNLVSYHIMFRLKIPKLKVEKDSTEEITKYVRSLISQRSFLYKRLMNAYPHMVVLKNKIKSLNNDIDEVNEY